VQPFFVGNAAAEAQESSGGGGGGGSGGSVEMASVMHDHRSTCGCSGDCSGFVH